MQCSGHGTCLRDADCREGDTCSAYCICATGYTGSDCGKTLAEMASLRSLVATLVNAMVSVLTAVGFLFSCRVTSCSCMLLAQIAGNAKSAPTAANAAKQVFTLAGLVADNPDQLTAADRDNALTLANSLVDDIDPTDFTTLNMLLKTIGALSAQAALDAKTATVDVVQTRRLYEHLRNSVSAGSGYLKSADRSVSRGLAHSMVSSQNSTASDSALDTLWYHVMPAVHTSRRMASMGDWMVLSEEDRHATLRALEVHALEVLPRRLDDAVSSAGAAQAQTNSILDAVSTNSLRDVTPFEAPITLSSPHVDMALARGGGGQPTGIVDDSGLGVDIPLDPTYSWNAAGSSMDTVAKQWKSDPYSYLNVSTPALASVTSFEIKDSTTSATLDVQNRAVPVVLSLSLPGATDTTTFRCSFWDEYHQSWSGDGAIVLDFTVLDSGAVIAYCGSVHLSEFSGVFNPSFLNFPDPNMFLDVGMFASLFSLKNLVPVTVVFSMIGFFAVSWYLSYRQDHKMAQEIALLRRAHQLMFGEISGGFGRDKLHLDMSTEGRDMLKRMEASFLLSKSRGSMVLAIHYIVKLWWYKTRVNHSLLSIFIPPMDDMIVISRAQRVATLCVGVLANMMTAALFFNSAPATSTQVAIAGIISGFAMLPFTDTFPYLFEKINTYRSYTLDLKDSVAERIAAKRKEKEEKKEEMLQRVRAMYAASAMRLKEQFSDTLLSRKLRERREKVASPANTAPSESALSLPLSEASNAVHAVAPADVVKSPVSASTKKTKKLWMQAMASTRPNRLFVETDGLVVASPRRGSLPMTIPTPSGSGGGSDSATNRYAKHVGGLVSVPDLKERSPKLSALIQSVRRRQQERSVASVVPVSPPAPAEPLSTAGAMFASAMLKSPLRREAHERYPAVEDEPPSVFSYDVPKPKAKGANLAFKLVAGEMDNDVDDPEDISIAAVLARRRLPPVLVPGRGFATQTARPAVEAPRSTPAAPVATSVDAVAGVTLVEPFVEGDSQHQVDVPSLTVDTTAKAVLPEIPQRARGRVVLPALVQPPRLKVRLADGALDLTPNQQLAQGMGQSVGKRSVTWGASPAVPTNRIVPVDTALPEAAYALEVPAVPKAKLGRFVDEYDDSVEDMDAEETAEQLGASYRVTKAFSDIDALEELGRRMRAGGDASTIPPEYPSTEMGRHLAVSNFALRDYPQVPAEVAIFQPSLLTEAAVYRGMRLRDKLIRDQPEIHEKLTRKWPDRSTVPDSTPAPALMTVVKSVKASTAAASGFTGLVSQVTELNKTVTGREAEMAPHAVSPMASESVNPAVAVAPPEQPAPGPARPPDKMSVMMWAGLSMFGIVQAFLGIFTALFGVYMAATGTNQSLTVAIMGAAGIIVFSLGTYAFLRVREERVKAAKVAIVVSFVVELVAGICLFAFGFKGWETVLQACSIVQGGSILASGLGAVVVVLNRQRRLREVVEKDMLVQRQRDMFEHARYTPLERMRARKALNTLIFSFRSVLSSLSTGTRAVNACGLRCGFDLLQAHEVETPGDSHG